MKTTKKLVIEFLMNEDGATMVEYVFTCALIAMVAIAGMKFVGNSAANKMNTVSGNIVNGQ